MTGPVGAGESWRKKREALGKSIDELSSEIHVAPKYLRGIEEGNWEGWPVRVFSTGFIRAYARKLSMDPEPVLSEYLRFVDVKAGVEPALQVRPEWLEREKERGSRRTVYTAAAGAVLLLGVLMAWYSTRSVPRPPKVPEVPVAPAPPAPAVENVVAAPEPPAPEPARGRKGKTAGAPQAPVPDRNAAAATGTAASAQGAGPYQLFLEARETTWLLYGRDDEAPTDAILQPGDRISIQAQRKIYLRLGNAGGVTATLNGKPLPPFGEAGRVREYRVGK